MAASAAARKAARSGGASPPANLEIKMSGSGSSGDMDGGLLIMRDWAVDQVPDVLAGRLAVQRGALTFYGQNRSGRKA
jgi:hypothetical protein